MDEKKLDVFVEVTENYFSTVSSLKVKSGTPFLTNNINDHLYEYTAMIPICGNHKGSVFFSTMALTAAKVLNDLDIHSLQPEKLLDLVGEISNTIAGNSRKKFGQEFMLKPPLLMHGDEGMVSLESSEVADTYVIPIAQAPFKSNLIIHLNAA